MPSADNFLLLQGCLQALEDLLIAVRMHPKVNYAKFVVITVTQNLDITATATVPFRTYDCQKRARCERGTLRCRVNLAFLGHAKPTKTPTPGAPTIIVSAPFLKYGKQKCASGTATVWAFDPTP